MTFRSTGRLSDSNTQCYAIARWLHEHGIAWSGTPAELASELSKAPFPGDSDWLLDPNELSAFLEANSEELSELGVDVSLRRTPGRPRSISLRSIGTGPENEETRHTESVLESEEPRQSEERDVFGRERDGQASHVDLIGGEQPDRFETAGSPEPMPLDEERTLLFSEQNNEEVSEPDLPAAQTTSAIGNLVEGGSITFQTIDSTRRTGFLPLVVAMLVGLIVVGLLFASSVKRDALAGGTAQPVPTEPSVSEEGFATQQQGEETQAAAATNQERSLKAKTPGAYRAQTAARQSDAGGVSGNSSDSELQRVAGEAEKKVAASQYDLGMRYAEGRGVRPDKVAAYTWLVLAWTNGEKRSDAALRALTRELSTVELQRVRIALGDFYSRGVGVAADQVAAHSWFTLAEVAGSAEGTIRKKQLEARMTSAQIEDAKARTTAWLSRH